ncbi:MAG: ABC transporter permease subunit [Rhizonema sp. PD37]|nr:ABC transporter permease subunit [Rhizonema sp. PD37]
MMYKFVDRIGDWNPQLLREFKGRLKIFPVAIAIGTSLIGQLVLLLAQISELPDERTYPIYDTYCKLRLSNAAKQIQAANTSDHTIFCPLDQIDLDLWWHDHYEYMFLSLSVIFIFTLLVGGTFALINSLAQEERRGTLNFIRLSPQSEMSILLGKLLGVPILIYIITLTAIPLHLWAGSSADIAWSSILGFYAILTACCVFFYSAALLFALVGGWLSGFQPWLGSGAVLLFLVMTFSLGSSDTSYSGEPISWLRTFSPFDITNYLFPNLFRMNSGSPLKELQFFNLPIGKSVIGLVCLHLLNYALWVYWIWQALKRSFRNPNISIVSKKQSFFIVASFVFILFGFFISNNLSKSTDRFGFFDKIQYLYVLNTVIFLGLMAILSPHRQAIQDWARYRCEGVSHSKGFLNKYLWSDLLWGEKSPAILAIAINLVMTATTSVVFILFVNGTGVSNFHRTQALLGVALFICLMMIYATIAQIMLMMKTHKRTFWAIGTIGAAILLPPIILSMLRIGVSHHNTYLWLFSNWSWYGVQNSATTTIFMSCLGELSILALLNIHLVKQVRLMGESATKALLSKSEC